MHYGVSLKMNIIEQYESNVSAGKWADALNDICQILERDSNVGSSWFNKAVCLDELGRHSEAAECFITAQEFDVLDWGIHFRILRSASLAKDEELFYGFAEYSCDLNPEIFDAILSEEEFATMKLSEKFEALKIRYQK